MGIIHLNPLLADAFFRAGYVEAWGRGIEKINHACREHDIQSPLYDFSMSGLIEIRTPKEVLIHERRQDI